MIISRCIFIKVGVSLTGAGRTRLKTKCVYYSSPDLLPQVEGRATRDYVLYWCRWERQRATPLTKNENWKRRCELKGWGGEKRDAEQYIVSGFEIPANNHNSVKFALWKSAELINKDERKSLWQSADNVQKAVTKLICTNAEGTFTKGYCSYTFINPQSRPATCGYWSL